MEYDVVVVGAGIQGSCTALYLAKAGKKVLLLEQFPLPHTRGSSHGQSRIIRTAYAEDFFTRMMGDAFALWRDIEKECGKDLILNTGLLVCAKPPYDDLESSQSNMIKFSPENYEQLSLEDARSRYPMIKFTENIKFFVDKSGGVIKANLALKTIQNLFCKHGGEILDGSPVTAITVSPNQVVLTTPGKMITSSKVVICCGPWANKVLKLTDLQLPLQPQKVQVFYFKEKQPGQYSKKEGFPSFINLEFRGIDIYGMPSIEYPGLVKVCVHHGVNCDPDERDRCPVIEEDKNLISSFIECHFPDIEPEPAIKETCMYTVTPDDSYILDYHPKYKNIIIGAGFSGSGFKISPLVGEILGQLVLEVAPRHDMRPFLISRFT